jgi:hypothetical protein
MDCKMINMMFYFTSIAIYFLIFLKEIINKNIKYMIINL